jgi:hypothetical protein
MAKRTNRRAWAVAGALALLVLGGLGLLVTQIVVQLYGYPNPTFGPYCSWVATHRGRNASLMNAQLRSVDLRGADLQGAQLGGADLTGANLGGANLVGARLRLVRLQGAQLQKADLHEADLTNIDLRGADLRGTDLTGAKLFLTLADLQAGPPGIPVPSLQEARQRVSPRFAGARCDAHTRWPKNFDPVKAGAVLVR